MPTPEQQREYTRLSGLLQDIGIRHQKELPCPGGLRCGLRYESSHYSVLICATDLWK